MSLKRIKRELIEIEETPPYYCAIQAPHDIKFDDTKKLTLKGLIIGPKNTPYSNGHFYLQIQLMQDYPFKQPQIKFITKILHCQINDRGGFYFPLRDVWSPRLTIADSMESIVNMLENPNTDEALLPHITKLYKTDRKQHDEMVRAHTLKNASGAIAIPRVSIIQRTLKYNAKNQQIICNFHINESESEIQNLKIRAHSKKHKINQDQSTFAVIEPKMNNYSFNINKQIEYGSIVNIISYIEWKNHQSVIDSKNVFPKTLLFDKETTEICVDILSQYQCLRLISGYLKYEYRQVVPMDVIKLCFEYYYMYSIKFIFQSFDTKGINNYKLLEQIQSEYAESEMILSNIYDVMKYDDHYNAVSEYQEYIWNIFSLGNIYRSSLKYMLRFDDASIWEYPKVIIARIELLKKAVFVANFNNLTQKIVIDSVEDYK